LHALLGKRVLDVLELVMPDHGLDLLHGFVSALKTNKRGPRPTPA
jgi:hypothetical protein